MVFGEFYIMVEIVNESAEDACDWNFQTKDEILESKK